jgi:hypothetical protein
MPSNPVESIQDIPTPIGKLKMYMATAEYNRNGALIVGYVDYPATSKNVPVQELLDASAQGAVRNSRSTLVSKKSITLDGFQGVELELLPPGNMSAAGRGAARIYWAAPRMYIMFAAGVKSSDTDESFRRFFDSFSLRKKVAFDSSRSHVHNLDTAFSF